jgi:hypothetical protein
MHTYDVVNAITPRIKPLNHFEALSAKQWKQFSMQFNRFSQQKLSKGKTQMQR